MNTAVSTTRSNYLDRVASGLQDLTDEDRAEVIQDLQAHLAELDEDAIEPTLGSPEEFVAEFRASAGLDQGAGRPVRSSIRAARTRMEESSQQLASIVRWKTWRPVWIWTRGWLLLSTIAVFSGGTAFRRFPIPTIEHSTVIGLALLVVATWLSVWLDGRSSPTAKGVSLVYSSFALLLLVISLWSVTDLGRSSSAVELVYPEQMVGPEGEPISNIYAYDLDGNPVEVLLFDQDGRPLKNLPFWIYEAAETNPAQEQPLEFGEFVVEFPRDEFGRIIPNLFPLSLYRYGTTGYEPVSPPNLGFPELEKAAEQENEFVTTTTPGR